MRKESPALSSSKFPSFLAAANAFLQRCGLYPDEYILGPILFGPRGSWPTGFVAARCDLLLALRLQSSGAGGGDLAPRCLRLNFHNSVSVFVLGGKAPVSGWQRLCLSWKSPRGGPGCTLSSSKRSRRGICGRNLTSLEKSLRLPPLAVSKAGAPTR